MTTKPQEAASTSTLGAGQTGQNSLINGQNGGVPSLISYPARPIQGGKLDRAPKKIGLWYAEPKYNGWRPVVHCPSGTMWNRHGGRLSIAGEFSMALGELKKLSKAGLIWADCEAMERRHNVGRRSLIVLDWISDLGSPTYEERRVFLESLLPLERMSLGEGTIPEDSVMLAPSIAETNGQALQLYRSLEAINRSVLADVFEGVVMKRAAHRVCARRGDEDSLDVANIQNGKVRHYDILRGETGQWTDSQGETAPSVDRSLPLHSQALFFLNLRDI